MASRLSRKTDTFLVNRLRGIPKHEATKDRLTIQAAIKLLKDRYKRDGELTLLNDERTVLDKYIPNWQQAVGKSLYSYVLTLGICYSHTLIAEQLSQYELKRIHSKIEDKKIRQRTKRYLDIGDDDDFTGSKKTSRK